MIVSLILLTSLAAAQDFKTVQQGEVAPISGVIITPDGLSKIITKHDTDLSICLEDSKHKLEIMQISKDATIQKLEFDLKQTTDSKDKIIEEKDKELERIYGLVKKQNSNLMPFWISLGFVTGTATTLGTIYVYNNLWTNK